MVEFAFFFGLLWQHAKVSKRYNAHTIKQKAIVNYAN